MPKTKSISFILAVLTMSLLVGYLAFAWTEPAVAPPGDNVDAPLNVSNVGQIKTGDLRVVGFRTDSHTWLATEGGRVGIGTTEPAEKLHVTGRIRLGAAPLDTMDAATKEYVDEKFLSSSMSIIRVYTSGATWTKPAGLRFVEVTVIGGGGGGGTSGTNQTVAGGSGAGGGGTSIKKIVAGSLGATETVTVGAGGGTAIAGGTSSFGSHCSATGGEGGTSHGPYSGGAGGAGSGGDLNIGGSGGGQSLTRSSASGSQSLGGTGGSSSLGGGGQGSSGGGRAYGGGGAGGIEGGGGGSGAAGVVIVKEFY